LQPDLSLCIDVDVREGLTRARRRNQENRNARSEARFDEQGLDFHQRVRQGYRKIAAAEPARFRMIDGSGTPVAVAERVWATVEPLLSENRS
jgi:dTMP kinase